MQIQIQSNQVITNEQSTQLILMVLIIFMVNIISIHFFMEYQMFPQIIHVFIEIEICSSFERKFLFLEMLFENHTNTTGI
jgi:hypothetical protein